mgnify:CR=1 FL=1
MVGTNVVKSKTYKWIWDNSSVLKSEMKLYKHPASNAPDGHYYQKGALKIPGTRLVYTKKQSDELNCWSIEEKHKI